MTAYQRNLVVYVCLGDLTLLLIDCTFLNNRILWWHCGCAGIISLFVMVFRTPRSAAALALDLMSSLARLKCGQTTSCHPGSSGKIFLCLFVAHDPVAVCVRSCNSECVRCCNSIFIVLT